MKKVIWFLLKIPPVLRCPPSVRSVLESFSEPVESDVVEESRDAGGVFIFVVSGCFVSMVVSGSFFVSTSGFGL
jgi:hypothetical protein